MPSPSSSSAPPRLPIRQWIGPRRGLLVLGIITLVLCYRLLGLEASELKTSREYLVTAGQFFSAALDPATEYQDDAVGANAKPIAQRALLGVVTMIRVAAGALAIALPAGLALGFLSARSWWRDLGIIPPAARRWYAPLNTGVRLLVTLLRSVHELLWAMLFLAAFGLTELTGTIAIAIPFAGTFGKVFGEILDEQDLAPASYLGAVGANPTHAFFTGVVPGAIPDLLSYAFYRFECALRSSAVIGFFGVESLGLYIRQSFENLYFNETWTYLYVLLVTLVLFEIWNIRIRRRLTSQPLH
ncbi:PhnE/PtxC family ABC transporter permease [Sulfuriroseicoccus oceanibius]|uniref:ABC transporter permease subunit n=1 Tax=Sulfuriroseicoccus oceanibius TaxID=2707525 RepID=A0A7T7EZ52_9BACT|nr:ABC transporter permease subunit [Sulfuriroseicoccus oceanibius]QQL43862.1 ABC transporter permease subunit [Sulfuriroseicoccus oceanibius]